MLQSNGVKREERITVQIILYLLKYVFVIGVGVEILLILRAFFKLARDKAHAATPHVQSTEE